VPKLLDNEREVRVVRQHWAVFVPVVAISALVLIVTFVVLKVLPHDVSGHDLHSVKVVIILVIGLAALGVLSLHYLRWRFTTYTITDRRVLVSRGVLSRYTESITLDRIQDTSVSQSLLGRIFRAGTVEIESAGRDGAEVIHLIPDPMGFSNQLQQAVEAHRMGTPLAPPGQPLHEGYVPPGSSGYGPPPGYGPPRQGGGV
jgi:uncharacterized membrane protein YdbT with pleckstrin-like domain